LGQRESADAAPIETKAVNQNQRILEEEEPRNQGFEKGAADQFEVTSRLRVGSVAREFGT
jgi:hypothetical protein